MQTDDSVTKQMSSLEMKNAQCLDIKVGNTEFHVSKLYPPLP